jgi:hypothetical protein
MYDLECYFLIKLLGDIIKNREIRTLYSLNASAGTSKAMERENTPEMAAQEIEV